MWYLFMSGYMIILLSLYSAHKEKQEKKCSNLYFQKSDLIYYFITNHVIKIASHRIVSHYFLTFVTRLWKTCFLKIYCKQTSNALLYLY